MSEVAAHNIRRAVEGLAKEIGRRVADDNFKDAEQSDMLKQVPPGFDFGGSIAERHAKAVLLDYLLGDFKPQ